MKLDPDLAQSIVDRMMSQIPYNINMMDASGHIIASGDMDRIGSLHLGAVSAIKAGHLLIMENSYGEHGQPGVNMPIIINDIIIGVIGITGAPDKVKPLASLLSTATELLITQSNNDELKNKYETRLNRFLYQWAQTTTPVEQETSLLLEAQQLKINIEVPRVAIAISSQDPTAIPMDGDDFHIATALNRLIILTKFDSSINRVTQFCKKNNLAFGIGTRTTAIGQSVKEALRTLELSVRLDDPTMTNFEHISFIDALLNSHLDLKNTLKKFTKLNQTDMGKELITTLDEYIRENENMENAAKNLHVHRNTLNYRLQKMSKETGLNPKKTSDLFQLFTTLLYFKFDNLD